MKKIRILLLLAVFTIMAVPQAKVLSAAPSPYDLIASVNTIRAQNGLDPVEPNGILMTIAQNHANYIASIQSGGHVDASGGQERDRALAAGFSVDAAGGWIDESWAAANSATSIDIMIYNSWSDPVHWGILVYPGAKFVGAGVAESGGLTYYVLDMAGDYVGADYASGLASTIPTNAVTAQVAPVQMATPGTDGSIIHIVKVGQAPWSIAAAYDITVDQLVAMNNLGTNPVIYVGQDLLIQLAYTPTPSPTATLTPRPPTRTPIPAQTAQPVETQKANDQSGTSIFNMDRRTMGLALILICGVGLALMVIGTVSRDKQPPKKEE